MKISRSTIYVTLVVIILFIGAEIVAHVYTAEIVSFVQGQGTFGKIFFIAMAMLAIVIPVWSNMFLLPFGTVAWGPFTTAILCILGWWVGSVVSFAIGRYAHSYILKRYPSFRKYQHLDYLIGKKHPLTSLVFLRMTLPVDILSYALGLFSQRTTALQNAVTTFIGIVPFALLFSYMGMMNLLAQILIFAAGTVLFLIYFFYRRNKNSTT